MSAGGKTLLHVATRQAERVEAMVLVSAAYLWVVPNGGHGPIFGKQGAPFEETALSFLRGEWTA